MNRIKPQEIIVFVLSIFCFSCSRQSQSSKIAFTGTWVEASNNTSYDVVTDGDRFRVTKNIPGGANIVVFDGQTIHETFISSAFGGDQKYTSSSEPASQDGLEVRKARFWQWGKSVKKDYSLQETGPGEPVCGRITKIIKMDLDGSTYNILVDSQYGIILSIPGLEPKICKGIQFGIYDEKAFQKPY